MTKRPWVIHPFLLAAFPILYLYSRNFRNVDGSDALMPIGLSLLAATLGFAGLRAIRFDGPTAGLIASLTLALFFSFNHGVRLCDRLGLGPDRTTRETTVLVVEGLTLAGSIALVRKAGSFAKVVNDACNASSVALVAMTIAGMFNAPWDRTETLEPKRSDPIAIPPRSEDEPRPDVYLLILDGYGRSDLLNQFYHYDNSKFIEHLERKGFVVAASSWSNYCQTALSLAASLNLRYLDDLAGHSTDDRRPLRTLIADNPTFAAFRQAGYRLVTFASGFDATESFDADLEIAPSGHLRTFHALMADQTPLWLLLGQRATRDPFLRHRRRILKVFNDLPVSSHPSDQPTFTFAHVVAPHPPFLFRADGGDASIGERGYSLADSEGWRQLPGHDGPTDYARRYREQVAYVTERVEQAIDQILATSKTPPIIVVMGDHGPGSRFDSSADRPNDVAERFGILNACYFPDCASQAISPTITPINTIRELLDRCLGTNLGPISDRSFYSSYARPYAFIEVTDELK